MGRKGGDGGEGSVVRLPPHSLAAPGRPVAPFALFAPIAPFAPGRYCMEAP